MVTQRDRLRLLQVGVGGDHHLRVLFSSLCQHGGEGSQFADPGLGGVGEVEAQVEGDLVVAGSAGVDLASHRAHDLDQAALDGGVDVLVGVEEGEGAVGGVGGDLVKSFQQAACLGLIQDADGSQHLDLGDGATHVPGQESAVFRSDRVPPQQIV